MSLTGKVTTKRERPVLHLQKTYRNVKMRIPNSSYHTEVQGAVPRTQNAKQKRGTPHSQISGPHRSAAVRIPNLKSKAEPLESL